MYWKRHFILENMSHLEMPSDLLVIFIFVCYKVDMHTALVLQRLQKQMPLPWTDGKQIQNVFKALGNCSDEIYLWRAFFFFWQHFVIVYFTSHQVSGQEISPSWCFYFYCFPSDCTKAFSLWYPSISCATSTWGKCCIWHKLCAAAADSGDFTVLWTCCNQDVFTSW